MLDRSTAAGSPADRRAPESSEISTMRHLPAPLLAVALVAAFTPPASAQTAAPARTPQRADAAPAADDVGDPVHEALVEATAAYVGAFNARRYDALADQWTDHAELVEGGGRVSGRGAIVESIRRWLEANPEARMAIALDGVKPLGAGLARIRGTIEFTEKPGAKPVSTRFETLRVLEEGRWRIAESVVQPSQVEALDALDWMIGSWKATDGDGSVEATYQRVAGGHLILGGIRIRGTGEELDVVELIHPDKASGTVRSWIFDSTGARAEGVFETDGTVFNRRFVGTTADGAEGTEARWVQSIVPTGPRTYTVQSIERTLDGRSLPDRKPIHFTRQR